MREPQQAPQVMASATAEPLVHTVKIWFARDAGGVTELLSFHRTYGTRVLDTFGGHCGEGESYVVTAWRAVVCEALYVRPAWEPLLQQALSCEPVVVRVQMRRRLHSAALWLVWLDASHDLDAPSLRPSGVQEAGGSLAWRPAADVLTSLRAHSFLDTSTAWLAAAVARGGEGRGGHDRHHEDAPRSMASASAAASEAEAAVIADSVAAHEANVIQRLIHGDQPNLTAAEALRISGAAAEKRSLAMAMKLSRKVATARAADDAAEAAQLAIVCADSSAEEAAARAADEAAEEAQVALVCADSQASDRQLRTSKQAAAAELRVLLKTTSEAEVVTMADSSAIGDNSRLQEPYEDGRGCHAEEDEGRSTPYQMTIPPNRTRDAAPCVPRPLKGAPEVQLESDLTGDHRGSRDPADRPALQGVRGAPTPHESRLLRTAVPASSTAEHYSRGDSEGRELAEQRTTDDVLAVDRLGMMHRCNLPATTPEAEVDSAPSRLQEPYEVNRGCQEGRSTTYQVTTPPNRTSDAALCVPRPLKGAPEVRLRSDLAGDHHRSQGSDHRPLLEAGEMRPPESRAKVTI